MLDSSQTRLYLNGLVNGLLYIWTQNTIQKTKNTKHKIDNMMVFHEAQGKQLVYRKPGRKLVSLLSA